MILKSLKEFRIMYLYSNAKNKYALTNSYEYV